MDSFVVSQQAPMSGRSFIIRDGGPPERIFGIDLVFDEGENFRAYIDEYTHHRSLKPKMYNQHTLVFSRSIGFDLTKQRDLQYLNALALDVVSNYLMDTD